MAECSAFRYVLVYYAVALAETRTILSYPNSNIVQLIYQMLYIPVQQLAGLFRHSVSVN